jgi:sigma-B regulation protein RsbU (phosphoserine phosphatase)
LERIGTLLRRVIDYQMFSIWILNEREQVLENRFALRFGERFYPEEKLPLDQGLVGAAIAERRLIHAPDVRKDPRYRMFNPETRSEMAMPLIYKGKVIGILDIEHTRPHFFNEDHERAITTLAAQVAISIENARRSPASPAAGSKAETYTRGALSAIFACQYPRRRSL